MSYRNLSDLDPDKVIASFNRAAATYDSVAELQRETARRLISRLDYIKFKPTVIIDIGAGTGYPTRLLEERCPKAQIFLLDIALNMLRSAKKHARWFTKQQFICADANNIPLPDHSVDFVFSNLMFQWCIDPEALFAEWCRVLRPDGLLLFSTFGPDTLKELRESWAFVDDYAHVNQFLDIHDVGDSLLQAKFSQPVLDVDHITLAFDSVYDLMRELKMLGAHNVNRHQRKSLTGKGRFDEMLMYYEKFRGSDNKIPATFEIVYGHAWGETLHQFKKQSEISVPITEILHSAKST